MSLPCAPPPQKRCSLKTFHLPALKNSFPAAIPAAIALGVGSPVINLNVGSIPWVMDVCSGFRLTNWAVEMFVWRNQCKKRCLPCTLFEMAIEHEPTAGKKHELNCKYDVWHLQRVHEQSGTNQVDFFTSKSSNSENRVCFIFDDLRWSSQSLFSPSHGVGYQQHKSQQSESEFVADRVSPSTREIPCWQVLTCLTWWMTGSCLWVTSALLICCGLRGLYIYIYILYI